MVDKYSLLQQLQELPFPETDYWVVAGGAMVLTIELFENRIEGRVEKVSGVPVVCGRVDTDEKKAWE